MHVRWQARLCIQTAMNGSESTIRGIGMPEADLLVWFEERSVDGRFLSMSCWSRKALALCRGIGATDTWLEHGRADACRTLLSRSCIMHRVMAEDTEARAAL